MESFTGGEDQSYFVNPRVAGSNPASPKGNCSLIGRAAECTVVKISSPVQSVGEPRVFAGSEWLGEAYQYPLARRQLKTPKIWQQEQLTPCFLCSSVTLGQISSVVEIGVTSQSAGAGRFASLNYQAG